MSVVVQLLVKAGMSIALKLLASAALEDLLVWILSSLAKSTKTEVDDDLVAIVRRYLGHTEPKVGE